MAAKFPQRKIGDDLVSAIGLGCMGMSIPSSAGNTDEESLRVLTQAADVSTPQILYQVNAHSSLLRLVLIQVLKVNNKADGN